MLTLWASQDGPVEVEPSALPGSMMAPGRGESEWREEGGHGPVQIEEEAIKDGKIRGKEGHKQNTA